MSTAMSTGSAPPPTTLERVRRRHEAIWALRSWLRSQGFLEVDTPLLVPGPGLEPHIDPLAVDVRVAFEGPPEKRWLITSPELAMKRLVAAGAHRIFQLSHVFRDGERTQRHAPEFTLLEWYRGGSTAAGSADDGRGCSLDDLVGDHEEMFADVAAALGVEAPRTPFQRTEVCDLFEQHAGIDLDAAIDSDRKGDGGGALVAAAQKSGLALREGADFDDAFFAVMDQKVEPNIGRERPVVVSRWPASMAVLAKKCDDDDRYAQRFEIYAGGLELSNAFDELTDPVEQRVRFNDDNAKRRALGKPELPLDEAFLAALAQMPRTAGCALGVDRLLMYLLGAADVDDVVALPFR
jgi:lysyl-tRNA synthetase class 2